MIIRRLTLHNFGIYAGDNTFEFNGNNPVVLIGGMNGRGKTTFLSGVLLSLYGMKSFAFKESSYTAYGQYLRSFINETDGTRETFIEMEFSLNAAVTETIRIRRSWDGNHKRVYENVSVWQNESPSRFLTENWDMYVESVLPSGISSFFFFDGEKIAELAVETSDIQIKESIRSLLGLNVIDTLMNDLDKVSSRIRKKSANLVDEEKLEELRNVKHQADLNLKEMDETIQKQTENLLQIDKDIGLEQARFKTLGGDIAKQQEEQTKILSSLKAEDQVNREKMLGFAASELPLYLVSNLLDQMQEQADKEQSNKNNEVASNILSQLISQYREQGYNIADAEDFINFFKERTAINPEDQIYSLSSQSLYQLRSLNSVKLKSIKNETRDLIKKKSALQEKIREAENYLAVSVNHEAIDETLRKINKRINDKSQLTASLSENVEKRRELHGVQIKATTEFNRMVESMLSTLEYKDDNDRALLYIHKVSKVLGQYEKALQKAKIEDLSRTITECYKQIADKKYLINQVKMDSDTLDFTYLDYEGKEVPKLSLSAGEKQMMVIAILWALAKCSRKKLPVIIDTPLSRLDGSHREALIKTYFPNASDQTIILSTDTEINQEYYQMMKPSIGDEFTLYYDDDTKSTTIKRGYIFGAEL